MRITGITSRIISDDVSAIYGEFGTPPAIDGEGVPHLLDAPGLGVEMD
jgi:hypothetical protein